jgi:hypothetical protein
MRRRNIKAQKLSVQLLPSYFRSGLYALKMPRSADAAAHGLVSRTRDVVLIPEAFCRIIWAVAGNWRERRIRYAALHSQKRAIFRANLVDRRMDSREFSRGVVRNAEVEGSIPFRSIGIARPPDRFAGPLLPPGKSCGIAPSVHVYGAIRLKNARSRHGYARSEIVAHDPPLDPAASHLVAQRAWRPDRTSGRSSPKASLKIPIVSAGLVEEPALPAAIACRAP